MWETGWLLKKYLDDLYDTPYIFNITIIFTIRAVEYGRKVHAAIDADSLSVIEWKVTTASVYDRIYHIYYC